MWHFLPPSPLPPPGAGPLGSADGLAAALVFALSIVALAPLLIAAVHRRHRAPALAPPRRSPGRARRSARLAVHAGAAHAP